MRKGLAKTINEAFFYLFYHPIENYHVKIA